MGTSLLSLEKPRKPSMGGKLYADRLENTVGVMVWSLLRIQTEP